MQLSTYRNTSYKLIYSGADGFLRSYFLGQECGPCEKAVKWNELLDAERDTCGDRKSCEK